MKEKIKQLNLVPLNEEMIKYLEKSFPNYSRNLTEQRWSFVKFYQGDPYFYSREYIEKHTVEELLLGFASISGGDKP